MVLSQAEWRQGLLSRCGVEVQQKLQQARVAIAGLGGLGSNIAVMLTRMGVEHLHLIDFDKVDITNLNRQQYFVAQLGMDKTEALSHNLRLINPYVQLRVDKVRVTEENITELFAEDEIICEAFDKPDYKAMLVNGILCNFPDKLVVAASGMAGCGAGNLIMTKRINRRLYVCGDGTSDCTKEYLVAPRVALCAAHQANLVNRLILGLEE